MRSAGMTSALIIAAFCAAMIIGVIPTHVAPGYGGSDLSPAFMPYVASGLALTFSILYVLTTLLKRAAEPDEPNPLPGSSWVFIACAALIFLAAVLALRWFGYLIAGLIIVAGFMTLSRARVVQGVVASIASPFVLWLLLVKVLGVSLP